MKLIACFHFFCHTRCDPKPRPGKGKRFFCRESLTRRDSAKCSQMRLLGYTMDIIDLDGFRQMISTIGRGAFFPEK